MKFITTTGYYGTGSSAITDLLSEFKEVFSTGDYEFRFIQDPDGISDLEFKLIENNHRHNSGHALKKYEKLVTFLNGNRVIKKYNHFFGKEWVSESKKYVDGLIECKYIGYWHQDVIDKGKYVYFRKRFINKILQKTIWRKKEKHYNELKNEYTYLSTPTETEFLYKTKEYINNLFKTINKEGKEFVLVDQIVASSNISRYTRYFDNIHVFLIDRDPRDIYLLEKHIWKSRTIPIDNIETFCNWYKSTRNHRKTEIFEDNVMFLYFEDLVYNYEVSVKKIKEWIGIKDHFRKNVFFNPKISINNTKLWLKYEFESKNIQIIEEKLNEYLYHYE